MILLALALFTPGGSCGSAGTHPAPRLQGKEESLTNGIWGGEHIRAAVTERGAEIEFDCARGIIPTQIAVNSHQFDVTGRFASEHPGPVRDEKSTTRSVRYKGSVQDQEMSLTISDINTKEVIGTFTLRFGNEGRLMKCR